jgi:hypothetical protein
MYDRMCQLASINTQGISEIMTSVSLYLYFSRREVQVSLLLSDVQHTSLQQVYMLCYTQLLDVFTD